MVASCKKNQRGQALVEFIIFLPFMLMLYTVVVILGDAIHGSINQQKATRSYFYYRLQNSSYITRPFRSGGTPVYTNWTSFGMFFLGWAETLDGANGTPVYPCYKLNLPFAAASGDACDQTYSAAGGEATTQFIRVGTVYGACGATYGKNTNGASSEYAEQPQGVASDQLIDAVISESSCLIN